MTQTPQPTLQLATDPQVRALRRSPLHDYTGKLQAAKLSSQHSFAVSEVAFLTMFALRAIPGTSAHEGLKQATGVGLPEAVGEVAGSAEDTAVLWISPDEFLLVAPDAPDEAHSLFQALREAVGEHRGDVVDVSANRTTLELTGSLVPEVLRKFVPTDLHPSVFTTNRAITTSAARTPVLLWRCTEDTWRLMPRASYAEHVADWVLDSLREFR